MRAHASTGHRFDEVNPHVTIERQVVPLDDLITTVQSRLQGKDAGSDLYDVEEPRLASFAARGLLADPSDIAEEPGDTVDEKALEATQHGGGQYATPPLLVLMFVQRYSTQSLTARA